MVRPENWIIPAGESPVRVNAGEPGSRPRFVVERRRVKHGAGEDVSAADGFVVLCTSQEQAEQAQWQAPTILGELGLSLHPDKTRVVDLRGGHQGFDFLGCHFHARTSGKLWEQRRIVHYYLQRWPAARSMKRARGNNFCTGSGSIKFREIDSYAWWRLPLAREEAGPQPACRSSRSADLCLPPRPGPVPLARHRPIPEGSVTMSRRPSVSRMRENRTYGSKGGWGTGLARASRP